MRWGRGALGLAALLAATAPVARANDAYCTGSYGGEPARPGAPLRFGIDPELAGSVGTGQSSAVPLDEEKDLAALRALRPPGRALVLRVNRLFWADGEAGIRRFEQIVAHHDAAGFDSELQVRYHPAAGDEGQLDAWVAYVRHVVDVFAPDRHVVAMTITNEVNLDVSQNTSDGAYAKATDALVRGVVAARDEADRLGRRDVAFGFTYAYRWNPASDARFWTAIGAGGNGFRRALGFVGVDVYPGTFYPPVSADPAADIVKALATVRRCYMPKAGLGDTVPIWITENGYESTPGLHTEAEQAGALEDMVRAAAAVSGTYGVTDYRWFNLRDNRSSSPGIFDTTGLLRDDYAAKPAFARYRTLIAALGAAQPAPTPCRSRRTVVLHLPAGARRVRVKIDGRSAPAHRRRGTLTIDLTGRPAGTARVRIAYRTRRGRPVTLRRAFRTCTRRAASAPLGSPAR